MDKKNEMYNFYLTAKGGWEVISGISMYPVLKHGWMVKMQPVTENDVEIGDIVGFGQNILTCHRIVGRMKFLNKTYFLHKGDNALVGGMFEGKDLIGKVTAVSDNKGQKVNKEKWQKPKCRNIKIINYSYLFIYLIRKSIFPGEKIDRLANLFDKFFWIFLLR